MRIKDRKGKGKDKGKGKGKGGDKDVESKKGNKRKDPSKNDSGKGLNDRGKDKGGAASTSVTDTNTICHYCRKKGRFKRDYRKLKQVQSSRDRARVQQAEESYPPVN